MAVNLSRCNGRLLVFLLLLPVAISACGGPGGSPVGTARVLAELPAEPFAQNMPAGRWIAWSPDGQRLLYASPKDAPGPAGALMSLDLRHPDTPRAVTARPASTPAWRPDGQAIAYVGSRPAPDPMRFVATVYLQAPINGEATDLLPGDLAVRGTSTAKMLHGWVDGHTLAYEEHVGSGVQDLGFIDTQQRRVLPTPRLLATFFAWDRSQARVAGQWFGGPPHFWLWDRGQGRYLLENSATLPGKYQFFEAWSDDGRQVLFTAWDQFPYSEAEARPTLYRLDLARGQAELLAENAGLAAWSADHLAYVEFGATLTLTVAAVPSGKVLWKRDLGSPAAAVRPLLPWWYRPVFAGDYLFFRTAAGEWQVTPGGLQSAVSLDRGDAVAIFPAPSGRHVAVLANATPARLRILANPLP